MSSYQRAPDGVWRSSPERLILWAVTGVLHKIEREIPETPTRRTWERKLASAIEAPVKKVAWRDLYRIEKAAGKPDVPEQVDESWSKLPDLIAGTSGLWMDAARERTTNLQLPFDEKAMEEAFAETMHLVSSIPETLHDRLRSIMRDAYDEQRGQFSFARQIRREFAGVSKFKAEQIAVTEWNRAASTATLVSYKEQGVELKRWYTVGDERVCPVCEDNSAEGEVGINDEFPSGDLAPPAHPGCRCDISAA